MTAANRVGCCVANNLHLYDAVLAPHGLSGAVADGLWTCAGEVPPYYSNAITVSAEGAEAQAHAIGKLARALDRPFAVKDSFATLDLVSEGFRSLFTADWIWRDARPMPAAGGSEHWQQITTSDDLASWEATWRESGSPTERCVFLPALLDNENVKVFAWRRDGRVMAGCLANRSDGLVGLSNFFSAAERWEPDLTAAIATVAGFAPGCPVVGYDHGDRLDAMVRLGFDVVGPLHLWLSPES